MAPSPSNWWRETGSPPESAVVVTHLSPASDWDYLRGAKLSVRLGETKGLGLTRVCSLFPLSDCLIFLLPICSLKSCYGKPIDQSHPALLLASESLMAVADVSGFKGNGSFIIPGCLCSLPLPSSRGTRLRLETHTWMLEALC